MSRKLVKMMMMMMMMISLRVLCVVADDCSEAVPPSGRELYVFKSASLIHVYT
jgi:hypothetical protein